MPPRVQCDYGNREVVDTTIPDTPASADVVKHSRHSVPLASTADRPTEKDVGIADLAG
jgi:hypothetical protein